MQVEEDGILGLLIVNFAGALLHLDLVAANDWDVWVGVQLLLQLLEVKILEEENFTRFLWIPWTEGHDPGLVVIDYQITALYSLIHIILVLLNQCQVIVDGREHGVWGSHVLKILYELITEAGWTCRRGVLLELWARKDLNLTIVSLAIILVYVLQQKNGLDFRSWIQHALLDHDVWCLLNLLRCFGLTNDWFPETPVFLRLLYLLCLLHLRLDIVDDRSACVLLDLPADHESVHVIEAAALLALDVWQAGEWSLLLRCLWLIMHPRHEATLYLLCCLDRVSLLLRHTHVSSLRLLRSTTRLLKACQFTIDRLLLGTVWWQLILAQE